MIDNKDSKMIDIIDQWWIHVQCAAKFEYPVLQM